MINIFLENHNDIETFCKNINKFIANEIGIKEAKINIIYNKKKVATKGYYDGKHNALFIPVDKTNINIFDVAHCIIHENVHLLLLSFMLLPKNTVLKQSIYGYNLDISSKYKNLLILDKMFYDTDWANKPYYYNLDSSELLAEKIAHYCTHKVYKELIEKDMSKNKSGLDVVKLFSQYINENTFFLNGDIYMKEIYINENLKRKENFKRKMLLFANGLKYKTNFRNIENYDIEKYKELYTEAKEEYLKYCSDC